MKADDPFTKLGKNDSVRFKLGGAQHIRANWLDQSHTARQCRQSGTEPGFAG